MKLLRKLSDLTVADRATLNNHLWLREYAKKRVHASAKQNKYSEQVAWESVVHHMEAEIADFLLVQP